MKQKIHAFCILTLGIGILLFVGIFLMISNHQRNNVPIQKMDATLIGVGTFQKSIKQSLGIKTVTSVYDKAYQSTAQSLIDQYKSLENYTIENPLFILNPYGTNRSGVYTYFQTNQAVSITYTVSVDDENIPDFTATMRSNDTGSATTEHEGQLIGLIQGYDNTVTFAIRDSRGTLLAKTSYQLSIPNFNTLDKLYFEIDKLQDATMLSDGLFTISDYDLQDPEEYSHILIVDNYGVIRAEIITDVIKACPVIEFVNNTIVYPANANMIVTMNRLGKIEQFYDLGQYLYHHDMEYNASNHTLAILADDTTRETIEEIVISLDLKSGQVRLVADFEVLMNDIYRRATRPELNMTNGTEFDWIHFNSIAFVNDTDVLLSSRELSSIIRVNDLYQNATIDSILGDFAIWENTKYSDFVYAKENEFSSAAGQHNLTVLHDNSLEDGQYYVTLYNNNWGYSPTWPEFDWSTLPGVNLDQFKITKGNMESAWYQYLVNDKTKSYRLIDKVELPYSSFVSNAQKMSNGNIIFCSGAISQVFGEYDSSGNVIASFHLAPDSYVGAYRVMKYTYQGFWFN